MLYAFRIGRLIAMALIVSVILITQSPHAAGQTADTTIAGCLQSAADGGAFVLVADDKETYSVEAGEGVELAPHLNHRVELTGTLEKNHAKAVLKATALTMVSSTCEA